MAIMTFITAVIEIPKKIKHSYMGKRYGAIWDLPIAIRTSAYKISFQIEMIFALFRIVGHRLPPTVALTVMKWTIFSVMNMRFIFTRKHLKSAINHRRQSAMNLDVHIYTKPNHRFLYSPHFEKFEIQ